jgi:DNA-binding beta-propeller fold protein YncE
LAAASALLGGCGGASPAPATPPAVEPAESHAVKSATACPCLYAAEGRSVVVYAANASGKAKPLADITGTKADLQASDVAADGKGNIYVSDGTDYGASEDTVTVYAKGATGNVAPIQTISGSKTGLDAPQGIALDPVNGDIYIANTNGKSVTVYASNANGNVAPAATISGSLTKLFAPWGIALDSDGNIYVANSGGAGITVFAAGANGNVAPLRLIKGTKTELDDAERLALDSSTNVYVTNYIISNGKDSVNAYAAGANGNVKPISKIAGANTKMKTPAGLAVDGSGEIYVGNEFDNSAAVNVYAAGANGNVKPIRQILDAKYGGVLGLSIR